MTYSRTEVQDEYVEGERRAVFVNSQVVVLSELGHLVLEALDAGVDDFSGIRDYLVAALGAPEDLDVDDRVREVLATLVESQLVQTSES